MIELRYHTSALWVQTVLDDFASFLNDHAAAEKKASGMAVSMLSHYPDRKELVKAMLDLAIEEMTHFRDVVRLMSERGICLQPDSKDPYIHALHKLQRANSAEYFLDRLLVAGIVEARGCERFNLIAQAQPDPALKRFYAAIGSSESRHSQLFLDLATLYFPKDDVMARQDYLLDAEARIVATLPIRAALH